MALKPHGPVKGAVIKDGIGLPSSHGCGASLAVAEAARRYGDSRSVIQSLACRR
jgi:hypothetical protein